ncbi:MAG: DNA polymerase IV [Chromatiales bacterium]|nr:DNA polymerase IV [Chromatiales bacterium]
MDQQRYIVHFDMDAFFASIEQRDFPAYAGKPIIVGGKPGERGVVATCSYEARPFGVASAMPSTTAARLCPQAIFVKPRFEVYRQVSAQIQRIFRNYTDLVEMLSLDEAYLDVSDSVASIEAARQLAYQVKNQILKETQLTVSAGISYNKFLAKIASDMDKPNGCYLISRKDSLDFVAQLPIGRFHGIGKVTQKRMQEIGITTGLDLRQCTRELLIKKFGRVGDYYYHAARGIDHRPVVPKRPRKSVGTETTFRHDLNHNDAIYEALKQRALEVARILTSRNLSGRTVTLKVKYADFQQVTRSHTLDHPLTGLQEMWAIILGLLQKTQAGKRPIRLLGIAVSNLCSSATLRQEQLKF